MIDDDTANKGSKLDNGWDQSAAAWIADLQRGGGARDYVLDAPMLARLRGRGFERAVDVGCGEGRFCRMMQALGIATVGIDPSLALLDQARTLDPQGDYRQGVAERLAFDDGAFDLVVSYLTLIDIADIDAAIPGMVRVLRPGGTLLIANMTSFYTAGPPEGWTNDHDGTPRFVIDDYMDDRADWVGWRGVHIQNHHRPLSRYMSLLLAQGLILRHFDEPQPHDGDADYRQRYRRVPYFLLMEWQKPG